MADGKLHIKGTITIKGGKTTKRKRKPRKKKSGTGDTSGYTGTGKADTRQEFGTPYTAQALMQAMSLRPQITYPQEQFKAPDIKQPALEQPKYYAIEEYSTAPPGSMIGIQKEDVKVKIAPMLEYAQQQGLEQGRQELLNLEQELMGARENIARTQDTERELTQKIQFMENGMEQAQASFQKQMADLQQQTRTEKERMRLELLDEKARSDASIVMEGILGKIELEAEKAKSQQEIEQLKQKSQQELQQAKVEGKKAEIKKMSTADLRGYFTREDPSFLLGNPKTKEMRAEVARREGVSEEERITSKPPTQEDLNKFFKTPIGQTKKMEDPVAKRLEMEKKAEEEYMQKFLQETTTKSTLNEPQNDKEIQRLLKLYAKPDISPSPLPDYQRTSSGLVTKKPTERDERFQMYSEDIRIKPFVVSEIGQIEKNPRYGLGDLGYRV